MSVDDDDTSETLRRLASDVGLALMRDFGLDGVVIKLHSGAHAGASALVGAHAPEKLDAIVIGQLEAMSAYVREHHGARETGSETIVRSADGAEHIARRGAKGESS